MKYVSDKYGSEPIIVETPEDFLRMAAELGLTRLDWHTDGDGDYYTDQDNDCVLVEITEPSCWETGTHPNSPALDES